MRVEEQGHPPRPVRHLLAPDDVVVRGGDMASWKLLENAQEHFRNPSTRGEWALSVASLPDATHEAIVAAAPQIRQRQYRVARARTLIDAGYEVVADAPPHALVLLPDEPTETMLAKLRDLFRDEQANPHFDERRQRGRSR